MGQNMGQPLTHIVKNQDGLYAVTYADKFKLHSLPGGGVEGGEDVLTTLRREVYEETGCVCDEIQELGKASQSVDRLNEVTKGLCL